MTIGAGLTVAGKAEDLLTVGLMLLLLGAMDFGRVGRRHFF
ncbi:hypothetical protein [Prescottella equi]|nr:hypothetical protein [Prescottella equi]MDP8015191.1 hypothetical protein [Prescottella equi]